LFAGSWGERKVPISRAKGKDENKRVGDVVIQKYVKSSHRRGNSKREGHRREAEGG